MFGRRGRSWPRDYRWRPSRRGSPRMRDGACASYYDKTAVAVRPRRSPRTVRTSARSTTPQDLAWTGQTAFRSQINLGMDLSSSINLYAYGYEGYRDADHPGVRSTRPARRSGLRRHGRADGPYRAACQGDDITARGEPTRSPTASRSTNRRQDGAGARDVGLLGAGLRGVGRRHPQFRQSRGACNRAGPYQNGAGGQSTYRISIGAV